MVRITDDDQVIHADDPADEERDSLVPDRANSEEDIPRPKRGLLSFPNKDKAKEKRAAMEAETVRGEVVSDKPKRGRPPGKANKTRTSTKRKEMLDQMFTMMGIILTPFNAYDGAVILKNGSELSKSLCLLADEDPRVAKMIDGLLTASTWSQVLSGFLAIGVPIAANHGLVPVKVTGIFGCPTPEEFADQQASHRAQLEGLGIGDL